MNRYAVVLTRDGVAFGILDRVLYDYCGLPRREGEQPQQLTWQTRGMAESWLLTCFQIWQQWEASGKEVPKGWRPHEGNGKSPFDRGWAFYA